MSVVKILTIEELDALKSSSKEHHRASSMAEVEKGKRSKTLKAPVKETERVLSLKDPEVMEAAFGTLQHLNVIMTNACNLSCTYCHEQHRKDFGRWDGDKLLKTYDFLASAPAARKAFQFFGGEPLLHKRAILQFLRDNVAHLEANAHHMQIRMITNGLLLDDEFIEEFLGYGFTEIVLSLDTIDVRYDHRGLKQSEIDRILNIIGNVKVEGDRPFPISIRCTLAPENSPLLPEFFTTLYGLGVRSITVHPLTTSLGQGFVNWPANLWTRMFQDITHALTVLDDLSIHFSEGVGTIGAGSNCMVGHGMVAIDASGDFSGCYFFNNLKDDGTADFMLGNLFDDQIYLDRYKYFHEKYERLFEHPECKECEVFGLCFQCPAGNVSTGGQLFQPDGMCKRVVRLHMMLNTFLNMKEGRAKLKSMAEMAETHGEDYVMRRVMFHLLTYHVLGRMPNSEVMIALDEFDVLPELEQICGSFGLECDLNIDNLERLPEYLALINASTPVSFDEVYLHIHDLYNIQRPVVTEIAPLVKAVTLHYIVLNKLKKTHPKIIEFA